MITSNKIINHIQKNNLIILYKTNISKELTEDWYDKRFSNCAYEAIIIVEIAAKFCLEEIRSTCYIHDHYEIPDLKKENLSHNVPKTLKTFLDIIIKTHKERSESNQLLYEKEFQHCRTVSYNLQGHDIFHRLFFFICDL